MSSSSESVQEVVYRFDRFELFPATGELRKRGTRLHLAPQPFRVLQLLLERAGEVVTREEIQQALWVSGTFVDYEQGINTAIRRIRFVLNDNAETPRFLQTLPRRGYCFLAPVERTDERPPAGRRGRQHWLPEAERTLSALNAVDAQTSAAEDPGRPSLASRRRVSPVAAIAAAALMLFAARGSHEVAAEVPRTGVRIAVAPVRVGPRISGSDGRQVVAELQTHLERVQPDHIRVVQAGAAADLRIETTLQDNGDGRRADARIVDTRTGKEVWTETMNRKGGQTEDFPLEIALRVMRAVTERYSPAPRDEPVVRTQGVSPRALALYRQARALRGGTAAGSDLEGALALFRQAVELEPKFAEAWSGIGNIWSEWSGSPGGTTRAKAIVEARTAIERAIALDPRCPEALNDYARLLLMRDRRYAAAEVWVRRAIEADPQYVPAHMSLALLLGAMGQNEKAIAAFHRAQELAPYRYQPSLHLAYLYLMGHRPDDALAEYHAAGLVMRAPFTANWGSMWASMMAGRWDDAARWLAVVLNEPVDLGDDPDRAASFRREFRRLEPKLAAMERAGRFDPYVKAVYHAVCQENDLALAALDRAIEAESINAIYAYVDPRLEPLRSDPRFRERLDRLGFLR